MAFRRRNPIRSRFGAARGDLLDLGLVRCSVLENQETQDESGEKDRESNRVGELSAEFFG